MGQLGIETIEIQIENRKLFLIGEFNDDMLINFTNMQSKGIKPESQIWINSAGGSTDTLWALRDLISIDPNIESIIGFGCVASAAGILFVTLPDCKRKLLTANASLMLHQVRFPTAYSEYEFEYKKLYEQIKAENEKVLGVIKKKIKNKKQRESIAERYSMGDDIFLTAKECLKLEIVEDILEEISLGKN